ncbi:MAG TPA: hypothetical protein VL422_12530 [Miltoncostaea sp.]|nr:hypothetical protein [Miltoncostaea sp.]
MRRPRRVRTLAAAIAAAAIAALALTLVPGAQATMKAPPKAPPATDVLLYRGATTVALDPGAAGALQTLGVSVAPTGPAYATKAGISFPITLGVVDGADLTGQIRHSGGLVFAKGATKVYLSRFFIDIDTTPSLSGKVGTAPGTGDRADLFDLDLSGLKVDAGWHRIALSGVTLKLTEGAANKLNEAFGVTAFTKGLVIGTATVRARTWAVPAA